MRFRPNLETLETREAPGGVSIAQLAAQLTHAVQAFQATGVHSAAAVHATSQELRQIGARAEAGVMDLARYHAEVALVEAAVAKVSGGTAG
jgi:hypothetical protein